MIFKLSKNHDENRLALSAIPPINPLEQETGTLFARSSPLS